MCPWGVCDSVYIPYRTLRITCQHGTSSPLSLSIRKREKGRLNVVFIVFYYYHVGITEHSLLCRM